MNAELNIYIHRRANMNDMCFKIIIFKYIFSRDCPIFYMRVKSRIDMAAKIKRIQRFGVPEW